MTLHEILQAKGALVHKIGPEATLADVVRVLVERNVGALLVCQGGGERTERLLGIITERDLLHVCAREPGRLEAIRVADAMTTDLVVGSPAMSVAEVMGIMTNRRIRHLPVVDAERLVGIVSIGDLVKAQHDRLAMEYEAMKGYIQTGRGPAVP